MNCSIVWTTQFKKDYKSAIRKNKDINLLDNVIKILASGSLLPAKYRDHQLIGNYADFRECHIQPDLLLIYKIQKDLPILTRTGSHSELFGK